MISPEKDCRLCGLCEGRTNLVLPSGDLDSPVVLVGEAPGENEDLQGAPFVGRAGQILNHNLYFMQFSPVAADNHAPKGAILDAINRDFGSFEAFKAEFEQKGTTLFGSGWVWLSAQPDGELVITQEAGAGNPVRTGL